jgi:hypothetical protein
MLMVLFRGWVLQRVIRAVRNPRNQERARSAYRNARGGGPAR